MSLLEWSAPERSSTDGILPTIPIEIYLDIFDFLVAPSGRLMHQDLQLLSKLSVVCRFFAVYCLSRIFEYLEFNGRMLYNVPVSESRGDANYKIWNGSMLVSQIAVKQPLALFFAKSVRFCHFDNRHVNEAGEWAVGLTPKEYVSGMSYMSNIRQFKLSDSIVDKDHWQAIFSLESLEELCFHGCQFLQCPTGTTLEEQVTLRVSRLEVIDCTGDFGPLAAVDAPNLHALAMNISLFNHVDWLSRSALTELCIRLGKDTPPGSWDSTKMCTILLQAPYTVQTLLLDIDGSEGPKEEFQRIFDLLTRINFPHLRAFTLQVFRSHPPPDLDVLSVALDGIGCLTNLGSCVLVDWDYVGGPQIQASEIRRIIHDKVLHHPSLRLIDAFGKGFSLEGDWEQAHG